HSNSNLYPYTTLFRSERKNAVKAREIAVGIPGQARQQRLFRGSRLVGVGRGDPAWQLLRTLHASGAAVSVGKIRGDFPSGADPTDRKSTRLNSSHLGI